MSPPFQSHFCTFSHQKTPFFTSFFIQNILIFKKLNLFLLSKMEVQAENGAKNHELTHSQILANLQVAPFRVLYY